MRATQSSAPKFLIWQSVAIGLFGGYSSRGKDDNGHKAEPRRRRSKEEKEKDGECLRTMSISWGEIVILLQL